MAPWEGSTVADPPMVSWLRSRLDGSRRLRRIEKRLLFGPAKARTSGNMVRELRLLVPYLLTSESELEARITSARGRRPGTQEARERLAMTRRALGVLRYFESIHEDLSRIARGDRATRRGRPRRWLGRTEPAERFNTRRLLSFYDDILERLLEKLTTAKLSAWLVHRLEIVKGDPLDLLDREAVLAIFAEHGNSPEASARRVLRALMTRGLWLVREESGPNHPVTPVPSDRKLEQVVRAGDPFLLSSAEREKLLERAWKEHGYRWGEHETSMTTRWERDGTQQVAILARRPAESLRDDTILGMGFDHFGDKVDLWIETRRRGNVPQREGPLGPRDPTPFRDDQGRTLNARALVKRELRDFERRGWPVHLHRDFLRLRRP